LQDTTIEKINALLARYPEVEQATTRMDQIST